MLRGRHQFGSIPGIHRHRPQPQLLLTDEVDQPLATMIAFAVTRARWFIPSVVVSQQRSAPGLPSYRIMSGMSGNGYSIHNYWQC